MACQNSQQFELGSFFRFQMNDSLGFLLFFSSLIIIRRQLIINLINYNKIGRIRLMQLLELGQKLGEGSFGTVYKALYDNQQRAAKEISLKKVRQYSLSKNLERQIQLMQKLKHKNIVQCFGAPIDDNRGLQYIILQLCDCNLRQYILKNPAQFQENVYLCTKITLQIFNALAYLKRNRIAHRDIKPDNIVVKKIGPKVSDIVIKLTDFGEARQFINASATANQIGTIGYMSPEVRNKQFSNYNESCDLWSIGVVIFQIFQGLDTNVEKKIDEFAWPFKENLQLDKKSEINRFYSTYINHPLTLSKKIPNLIRTIIRGLLKAEPTQRITIEQITTICITKQSQLFKNFDGIQKEYFANQFIVWQIQEKQLEEQKQAEKIIIGQIVCLFDILKKIQKSLNNLVSSFRIYDNRILQIDTALEATVFYCKIYQKIKKRRQQLQMVYNWKDEDIQKYLPQIQQQTTIKSYDKYYEILSQFKMNPQEMQLHVDKIKAFIKKYCLLYKNNMLQSIEKYFTEFQS